MSGKSGRRKQYNGDILNKQSLMTSRLALLLALGATTLTGCLSDSGNNSNDVSGVLRGRLQGDANGVSATAWAGTSVTTHTVSADGTLSAAVDSVSAETDGSFTISGAGAKEWIIRARRADTVWMARYDGTLVDGQTEEARPLNLQTTVEAAVWLELKKSVEGREVLTSEVDLAIDAATAASARAEYRSNATVSNSLVGRLATSIKAASRARHAYLTSGDSLYTSKRASIDSARSAAEDTLTASLYTAAADTAQIHAAERAYVSATVNAYVGAGVGRVAYARSSEASYHAMLRNSTLLTDSARTTVARNYARILVMASDTAMRSEFRAAGSSLVRSTLVSTAGATFAAAVEAAPSRAQIDTAVVRYRTGVRTAFNSISDTTFNIFKTVASEIAVTSMTDSLSLSLTNVVGASSTGEAVGTAYATAQLSAQSSLRTRIETVNTDDAQARAAAYVLAFLSVRSSLN
jgi:hypothetical protein